MFILIFLFQYFTSSRNRAWPGIDSPAAVRRPLSITPRNPSTVRRCRPTSMSVPTTARTMLRRKRLAVISTLAKSREVIIFHQNCRCLVHQVKIELIVKFTRISPQKRFLDRMYIIMVRARSGTETCMHIVGNRFHTTHGDVARQKTVEFIYQLSAGAKARTMLSAILPARRYRWAESATHDSACRRN